MKHVLASLANKSFSYTRKPSIKWLSKEVNQELIDKELEYYAAINPTIDTEKLKQYATFLGTQSVAVFEGKCLIEPEAGQVLYGRWQQKINNAFNPYELADPLAYIPAVPHVISVFSAKKVLLEEAVYLRDGWHNLYHFYFDVVGQLMMIEQLLPAGIPIVVPHDYCKLPFVNEVLQRLGLNTLNFFPQPPQTNVLVQKHLYLVKDFVLNNSVIQRLRAAFGNINMVDGASHIFLSRLPGSNRSLYNAHDVNKIMEQEGITTVYAEHESFLNQVKIFSQAKLLVGLHGAGLANIIFMPHHARIIECMPAGYYQRNLAIHYLRLANHIGIAHVALEGGELNEVQQYALPVSEVKASLCN